MFDRDFSYKRFSVLFLIVLLLASFVGKAQFYNLPNDHNFSLLTERGLATKDSSLHSGLKPYIHFFNSKYEHIPDSHRIFKFIVDDPALDAMFFKHVVRVQPPNENFKLRLDPILNFEKGKDLSDTINRSLNTNTRGLIASGYIGDKFYFETMFAENQSTFPVYVSNVAKATLVVPGQGRWKTFKTTGYDYAFSSGFVSIQALKNLNIQVGHGKHKIGSGYRSLLLSDNAFNYPYARITQQWFKGRVSYTNIYSVLMNLDSASKHPTPNAERLFQKKAASFQYLSINVSKKLNVGFFQGMVWHAGDDKNKQDITWQYFNPVIYSNLPEYGLNNKNNIVVGGDIKFKVTNKLNLYGQVMADDLSGVKKYGDAIGFQVGANFYDVFGVKNLFFQVEYNDVNENSYVSPLGTTSNQSYSHYNQNLAYTPGSGKEIIAVADYKWKRFFVNMKYNNQTILKNGDFFYTNQLINTKIGYLINPAYNLTVNLGYTYRMQNFNNFATLNNQTNYIYLGIRTSIYNLYYDF
ncbi:MAG: hypothetical protein H0W73_06675 [Bacteroidetes bacterium]|nr:hypothetical protein [Bacteroidota bacterium]